MASDNKTATRQKAILLMICAAVLWSIGGLFIKLIPWSPFLIAGVRSMISGLVMAIFMRARGTVYKLNRYSLVAGIGLAGSATFFTVANKLTTAANAIVLQYTAPVFILIISALLLRQKLKRRDIAVVAVTLAGMLLFFFDQLSPGNIAGNLLAILAGIFLAFMFVMIGMSGDDDSTRLSGLLNAHAITMMVGIPIGIALTSGLGKLMQRQPMAEAASPVEISPLSQSGGGVMSGFTGIVVDPGKEVLCVIVLGVFQLGLSYVFYGMASKDCNPLACSLIGMLEPLLNPVWVALFIGEAPGPYALAGGVVIVSAVTWWCVVDGRAEEESAGKAETDGRAEEQSAGKAEAKTDGRDEGAG